VADDATLRREFAKAMQAPDSPHVSDETWEALALHELSPPERDVVARHVVACAACGEIYRSLLGLEDEAREFDAGVPAAAPVVVSTSSRTWMAVAASVAVVLSGVVGYRVLLAPSSSIEIAQPAAPAATLARIQVVPPEVRLSASRALATRGASDQKAFLEAFGKAIEPYRSGRYAEAATALAPVAAGYPDAYEPLFYQAVSSLLVGDAAAALGLFDRLQPLAPASLHEEIRFYRAAALQGTNQVDLARAELRTLCQGGGSYRDRACALLK
jgi:hypothetical protein